MESFQNPRVQTHSITNIVGHTYGVPVVIVRACRPGDVEVVDIKAEGISRCLCAEFHQPSSSPGSIFDNNLQELIQLKNLFKMIEDTKTRIPVQ